MSGRDRKSRSSFPQIPSVATVVSIVAQAPTLITYPYLNAKAYKMRYLDTPMYPKSPIERPPRVAVPSRSRSDPSHIHASPSPPPQPSSSSPGELSPPPAPEALQLLPPLRVKIPTTLIPFDQSTLPNSRSTSSSVSSRERESVDKDTLIARLSTSAALLEADFVRDLTHLSTQLSHTSSSLSMWKESHASLLESHNQLKAQFDALGDELDRKEAEERESKTRISSLLIEREILRRRYESGRTTARDREEEVERLRNHVQGLKRWVSSSSRTEGQVTDEVVAESFANLGAGLQNWVLKNFRRAKLRSVEDIARHVKEEIDLLCPTWETLLASGVAKVHLIQSLVSRLLVQRVFSAYFVGLPEEKEKELQNFDAWLEETSQDDADVNQWRAATLGVINKPGLLSKLGSRTEETVSFLARDVINILDGMTIGEGASEHEVRGLHTLINEAVSISRILRVQKAYFNVVMLVLEPHQVNIFEPESMDDIGGEDEESLQGREVVCVTLPVVVKEGDENGQRTQLRNVISKAKVLCLGD